MFVCLFVQTSSAFVSNYDGFTNARKLLAYYSLPAALIANVSFLHDPPLPGMTSERSLISGLKW